MSELACQLSYAAGSTSLDPYGFRTIDVRAPRSFDRLLSEFPMFMDYFSINALIVSAYPAGLGLAGTAPLVDTYLHPPTFFRSLRLAAKEKRPVLFASQPLAGADLLIRHCAQNLEMPRRLLWANGGYYLPVSLEKCIRTLLAEQGCELMCLYSYGVAEIAHTCFAAVNRFDCGLPRYKLVASDVTPSVNAASELSLASSERSVATGDTAAVVEGDWKITGSTTRLQPLVFSELESWSIGDWKRRTGYLVNLAERRLFQLREDVCAESNEFEIGFHDFWKRNGGSFTYKPNWGAR